MRTDRISYAKKEIDAPEWTPFLDGCLQTLSQSPEWPGDEQLAAQVKMQLLVDQLNRGPWKNQELQPYCSSYLEGLLSQLEKIKAQLPPSLTQNGQYASESFSRLSENIFSPLSICSILEIFTNLRKYESYS